MASNVLRHWLFPRDILRQIIAFGFDRFNSKQSMLNEALFDSWVKKEKRAALAKKRKYPHFDPKINFTKNISFFKSYFSDSKNVSTHSFYPFIRMEIATPKFKKTQEKDELGKSIRKMYSKKRPLAYSAHFDAFIYSWFSTLLTDCYEKEIKKAGIYENVLAYLAKGSSNIEFAHEVFQYISLKGECVALAFDVSSFFDGLDHVQLNRMWSRVIHKTRLPEDHFKVFKSLTEYNYVEKNDLENVFPHLIDHAKIKLPIKRICEPSEFREKIRKKGLIKKNSFRNKVATSSRHNKICGIPQGSPMSACLSNIYMIEFDIEIQKTISQLGGLYRRYSDDIIVIVDHDQADNIKREVLEKIKTYHLEINEGKTEVTYFNKDANGILRGFDLDGNYRMLQYLGFEFSGQNTYIRSSSMSRYFKQMTARIRENIKAAYGKNSIGTKVFKKKLYNRYTDKGDRNFITYAQRAMKIMESETIKKQVKNSIQKVSNRFDKKKTAFEFKKNPAKKME